MAALDRQVEHFVPWSCSSSTEHAFPINTDLLLQLMLLSSCCCSGIYLEFTGWLKWPLIFQQHTESICSSAAAEVVPRQAQEPAGRIWGGFFSTNRWKQISSCWNRWGTNFGAVSSVCPHRNGAQTQTWVFGSLLLMLLRWQERDFVCEWNCSGKPHTWKKKKNKTE